MRALAALTLTLALSGCEKTCKSDRDCVLPALCSDERRCVAPLPRLDGASCSDDLHCAGRVCLRSPLGNTCATGCESAGDCDTHRCVASVDARPAASTLRFTCSAPAGERFATETCRRDGDCRTGLCHDAHCTTPCGSCPVDFACVPATLTRGALTVEHGVCSWFPQPEVLELGAVDTSETSVTSRELNLKPGFGAFTIVLEAADQSVPLVSRLVAPDGTVLIGSLRAGDAGSLDLARCSSAPGLATVLVPGSDGLSSAPPGSYRLELASNAATGQRVSAHIDRVAAVLTRPARGGRVDLTLHLAPETGFSAADGGGALVRGMLERFDQLAREKLGVTLGDVRVLALPGDAGALLETRAAQQALVAEHSVGGAGRPINVMVVRSLADAGVAEALAPFAPGVYARTSSGVTITPHVAGPASTGVVLMHEVSHALGLFHTSDVMGGDLISDTPLCTLDGGCPDERNLMSPDFKTSDPLTLSAGQAHVLEGSPWVYRPLMPDACGDLEVLALTGTPAWVAGTTVGGTLNYTGTCGGAGAERLHFYRLEGSVRKLEARVKGAGFTPVLYARRAECGAAAAEGACSIGDAGVAAVTVETPAAGPWFFVVDSLGDGGVYELTVTVTP